MRRTFQDLASLAARLGVGGIFFANGWHKLEFGLTATSEQFAKMDAPAPGIWAASTMLIELIGGALLVAGLAVPACGLILFAEALAVFVLVSGDTGLPLTGGDINLIVALGAASVLLAVVGAGRLSIDHLVVIRRREAEAADDMAADAEADDVISSWRETTGSTAPAETPAPQDSGGAGTGGGTAKGPVTFPEKRAGSGDATEVTAPRKARPRRTTKPVEGAEETLADAPSTSAVKSDRLVAGGRKSSTPDHGQA
ncbi:DoxX family protein [Sphaerisporangium perillae]|uniref:DoxX family protein n=1 Tax=Sphaerisporangium perillae TaxID=2935860 RepID=UPI00200D144B|nr:DoxX family protein [Sphaerisporangium perillae]